MEDLLIKLFPKPSKYEKVFGGKCSLTKTFELSSHMLGCTGDLDETGDIQNNMIETSWQKYASFHVKMSV